jgi:hypothetical protein
VVDATVLHGSVGHLAAADAPSVALASCGLEYRVEGDRLVVSGGAAGAD